MYSISFGKSLGAVVAATAASVVLQVLESIHRSVGAGTVSRVSLANFSICSKYFTTAFKMMFFS